MQSDRKIVIDLGCNDRTLLGYDRVIRVDLNKTAPDIVISDFNNSSLPFPDNYADEIHCYHVLEHLQSPAKFLKEICRVAKPNADVFVAVPHYSAPVAYGDPSHLHQFSLLYFYYFGEKFKYEDCFRVKGHKFTILPTTLIRYADQPIPSLFKRFLAYWLQLIPNLLPPLIGDRLGGLFGGYHEMLVKMSTKK